MSKRGLIVKSFGSGQQVKLPGTSLDKPNVYTFDTTYESMYKDLFNKDANLFVKPALVFHRTLSFYRRQVHPEWCSSHAGSQPAHQRKA